MRRRIGGRSCIGRRRGSKVNRDDTRSPFNTFNGKKRQKYIHEKKTVQCSNAIAFAVGNVDVF